MTNLKITIISQAKKNYK